MKSLICSLGLILMGFICQAQTFPTTSNFGGATTLMKNPNYGGTQGGLIPYTFSDTIAANAALTYLKNYDGSLIKTTSPNAIWWRDLALHKWVMILPAGSPVVNDAWTLNGNVVGSLGAQPLLGTQDFYDLNLITNSTIQASIPANGINRVSASKYKYLVIDTTASQGHQLGFMDGGSGSSGWSLTGNSGTTAGTNFLGTTDSVGLMFKANNIQSGYINLQKTSTSLGYYSLNSNTIGTGNEAFGARSLMANTVGNGNQAFGTNTLTANTSGSGNVAVGSDVLSANTIGQNNTGVGNAASLTNIVGNENSAFGLNSLLISSGSNNVAIGAYAGQSNGTFSNRLYVNSLYRADLLSDTTKSIIYGAQDATASNQRLYANSQFFLPYAASQYNAADSMMVILPSTGKVGYRVIPSGNPGTVTSVATGYGLSGGTITTTGTLIADTSILVNKTGVQTITNKTINGANNSLTVRLANDVTGVLPITNGGTNNGSLSVTNGNLYYGDGTKLVGLGIGTTKQTLHVVAGIPAWVDTAATAAQVYPGAGIANSTGSAWGTSYTTTGSGTVVALQTSPTFVTNITSPLIIGGTGTTSSLTYKTTTGVGTTGADHIFLVGNNGATEAMRILNNGNVGIGTAAPSQQLEVVNNMLLGSSSGTGQSLYFKNSIRTDNFRQRTYGAHTGFVWNLAGSDLMYLNDDGQLQTVSLNTGAIAASSFGLSGVGLIPLNIASTNNSIARLSLTSHSNTWYIDNRGTIDATNDRLAISNGGSDFLSILTTGNVGIGTTSPNSTLHTNGSFATAYVAKTANYTLTSSDYLVEVTSGTVTETLPTAVGIIGRIYVITNSGSGVVTLGTTSSQTFANVVATPTTLTLNQFATVTVISNGTNWLRITSL